MCPLLLQSTRLNSTRIPFAKLLFPASRTNSNLIKLAVSRNSRHAYRSISYYYLGTDIPQPHLRRRMSPNKPSSTLADFVKDQRARYLQAVQNGRGKEWTVVMGNEAGDLDSLASAIGLSWWMAATQKSASVPLYRASRTDLHLRAENLHALELAGMDPSNPPVLFLDDLPTSTPFSSNRFALVDHNRLHVDFTRDNPDARVVAVVDHHEDEGLYKDTADPRLITVPTGSASSLVAHLLLKEPYEMPAELATLLLCSILIDTGGLKPGGKAEETDHAVAVSLANRSLLPIQVTDFVTPNLHEDPDIQELSSVLHTKKSSISHLDTRDLLRRDYKEYIMVPSWATDQTIHVGLSSVPVGLKAMLSRDPKFWSSIQQWMTDRNLAVLGVLTSFRAEKQLNKKGKPKHKREQLFVVREDPKVPGLVEKLFTGLEASEELRLKKKNLSKGDDQEEASPGEFRAWKQGNVEATRKVTAPLVKKIIEGN